MNRVRGFLVTGDSLLCNNVPYNGIECDPWPLGRELLEQALTREQMDLFDSQTDDLCVADGIALLDDVTLLRKYVQACKTYKQAYCVKLLEVYRAHSSPVAEAYLSESLTIPFRFLGYDVGECAYDYYSSILSDIIKRPFLFGGEIRNSLNDNGLFASFDAAESFLAQREEKMQLDTASVFETCHPAVIKIYSAAF